MKKSGWLKSSSWVWITALLIACQNQESPQTPDLTARYEFTFEQGTEGWQAGFVDYRKVQEADYELRASLEPLPASLNASSKALFISGRNLSDDLFMFSKRPITDLKPNQLYEVVFEIELASQYPTHSIGIGGSPGSSVFLKAGATTEEPLTTEDERGYIRMNIDKSNQSSDGEDMQVIGDIGIPGDQFEYTLIQRSNAGMPFRVTTGGEGKLWLIFGTESGFEATTALYFNRVKVTLQPADS